MWLAFLPSMSIINIWRKRPDLYIVCSQCASKRLNRSGPKTSLMIFYHRYHIQISGGYCFLEVKCLQDHPRSEWDIRMDSEHQYLTWFIFIANIFWPPEVSKYWRSRPRGPFGVKGESECKRNTKNPMIWCLTGLIFIDLIFRPFLEVIIEGRS